MQPTTSTNEIRTEKVPSCLLCGEEKREVLHTGLKDHLFGAPGEWILKQCCRCGLVFLDPRPTLKDIGKVYATYYTHSVREPSNNPLPRLRRYVHGGYLAIKLGYTEDVPLPQRFAGWLAYLHPEEQEVIRSSVMHLPAKHKGRVLDVGCGTGETLQELRRLGWEAEGVDFDVKAAETARRSYGLTVRLGTLGEQEYPSNYFDAVGMSHVIEHVHDPVKLLAECRRILKPGGRLIVATPNVDSFGHRRFGTSWSSLVAPSHLCLFSSKTLAETALKAGFASIQVRTSVRGAYGVAIESQRIKKARANVGQPPGSVLEKLRGHLYQYAESAILRFKPDTGEELLMVARK